MVTLLTNSQWTFQGLQTLSLVAIDTYTFIIKTSWGDDDQEFSSWQVALESYFEELAHLQYSSEVWCRAQVNKLEAKLSLEVDEVFMARQFEQALVKSELVLVKSWDMWASSAFEQVELWKYAEYQILAQYTGDVQVFEVFLNNLKIDFDSWDCCSGWYPTIQEWVLDWVKLNR